MAEATIPELHEAQKSIALDPHRFRVVNCGRRFGKTYLSIDQMKARAAIANSRIAYIAPTFQQARDICWAQLKRDTEQAAQSINESRLEITLVNGSQIFLRGWEAVETLRGQNFHLLVIDEIASMRNFWEAWREVLRPTLTDFKGEAIFISTPKGFNHFYELYNMENDPEKGSEYKSFHYTTYDNPHMPKEEVDAAKRELTEDAFAQEYLADFRKTEGLVYKEFDRKQHVFKEDPDDFIKDKGQHIVRRLGGCDFGFVHPCAVLSIDYTSDGLFIVRDEWYMPGKTDAEIAEYVSGKNYHVVYPDPQNAGGVKELKNYGVNVRDVIKGKDSVKNGINVVREMLKQNRLFISGTCENLIFEFETYSYGEKGTKAKVDENPIKENDDALDALRYVLMMNANRTGFNKPKIYRPKYTGFNTRG